MKTLPIKLHELSETVYAGEIQNILDFLKERYADIRESIQKALVIDSCYSTILGWSISNQEMKAWHAGPENMFETGDMDMIHVGSLTVESPEGEELEEEIRDYLEEEIDMDNMDDTQKAVTTNGIWATAAALKDGKKSDPEGIRQIVIDSWIEKKVKYIVEDWVDGLIEELEEMSPLGQAKKKMAELCREQIKDWVSLLGKGATIQKMRISYTYGEAILEVDGLHYGDTVPAGYQEDLDELVKEAVEAWEDAVIEEYTQAHTVKVNEWEEEGSEGEEPEEIEPTGKDFLEVAKLSSAYENSDEGRLTLFTHAGTMFFEVREAQ